MKTFLLYYVPITFYLFPWSHTPFPPAIPELPLSIHPALLPKVPRYFDCTLWPWYFRNIQNDNCIWLFSAGTSITHRWVFGDFAVLPTILGVLLREHYYSISFANVTSELPIELCETFEIHCDIITKTDLFCLWQWTLHGLHYINTAPYSSPYEKKGFSFVFPHFCLCCLISGERIWKRRKHIGRRKKRCLLENSKRRRRKYSVFLVSNLVRMVSNHPSLPPSRLWKTLRLKLFKLGFDPLEKNFLTLHDHPAKLGCD